MNYFNYYEVITLIVFLIVFFGRTIWLRRKGAKIFVIGSGKKGFAAFLEKKLFSFFPDLVDRNRHSFLAPKYPIPAVGDGRSSSMPNRRKFIHLALCCTGII